MEVYVGNDIESAIRLFRRKINRDGTVREVREQKFRGFEKPSVKRRRKERDALNRIKREKRRSEKRKEWTGFR